MSEEKYIIKYKMADFHEWCYSTDIRENATYSCVYRYREDATKMTLKEAEKNVIKIKKIRGKKLSRIVEIQIIDIKTGKIVISRPKEISRFELMDI